MTVKQMQTTMETMRSICGPKNKVTDDQIDGKFNNLLKENIFDIIEISYRIKERSVHRRQRFKMLHIMCCTNGWNNEEK